jgi:hypothetical protein
MDTSLHLERPTTYGPQLWSHSLELYTTTVNYRTSTDLSTLTLVQIFDLSARPALNHKLTTTMNR